MSQSDIECRYVTNIRLQLSFLIF